MKPNSEKLSTQLRKRAVRIDEAASLLGVSHWTVRRLIKRGELRSCRQLRCHLIPLSEIERFLDLSNLSNLSK